jgi:hypothetical protein
MSLDPLYLSRDAQISERHTGVKSTSTHMPSRSIPCSSERTSQNLEPEAVDKYQPRPRIASRISSEQMDMCRGSAYRFGCRTGLRNERHQQNLWILEAGTTNLASLEVQDFTHTINERGISAHICGSPYHPALMSGRLVRRLSWPNQQTRRRRVQSVMGREIKV